MREARKAESGRRAARVVARLRTVPLVVQAEAEPHVHDARELGERGEEPPVGGELARHRRRRRRRTVVVICGGDLDALVAEGGDGHRAPQHERSARTREVLAAAHPVDRRDALRTGRAQHFDRRPPAALVELALRCAGAAAAATPRARDDARAEQRHRPARPRDGEPSAPRRRECALRRGPPGEHVRRRAGRRRHLGVAPRERNDGLAHAGTAALIHKHVGEPLPRHPPPRARAARRTCRQARDLARRQRRRPADAHAIKHNRERRTVDDRDARAATVRHPLSPRVHCVYRGCCCCVTETVGFERLTML